MVSIYTTSTCFKKGPPDFQLYQNEIRSDDPTHSKFRGAIGNVKYYIKVTPKFDINSTTKIYKEFNVEFENEPVVKFNRTESNEPVEQFKEDVTLKETNYHICHKDCVKMEKSCNAQEKLTLAKTVMDEYLVPCF